MLALAYLLLVVGQVCLALISPTVYMARNDNDDDYLTVVAILILVGFSLIILGVNLTYSYA